VIALYREARIVPQLLAAMDRIDYPRAKLDVKFVIEEDDEETLGALMQAARLPGEVVVAPAGTPHTKPRALNVALPLLRGQFVVVFDAEDVPDPLQIKMAAGGSRRLLRGLPVCRHASPSTTPATDG